MLKRQRPVSPPPTFSSIPLVVADPPADFVGRDTKRRRTLPPVLDGAHRGWAQAPPLPINIAEDDEEDYISDDEIENIAPNFSNNCSLIQQQPGDKAEYSSTNSFLRELHTLQQHRLLFPSPPPPPTASSFSSCGSNPKDTTHSPNILSYSGHYPPLNKGHSNLSPQLPVERLRMSSQMSPTPFPKLSQQQSPIDEIHSVTEHYEDTNKYVAFTDIDDKLSSITSFSRFLGSLFLSRRRILDSSPGS